MTPIQQEVFKYADGSTQCEGLVCRQANLAQPSPVVVICPHWNGRDALMDENAMRVARMGTIGFAADIYGGHATATERDACAALMTPFVENRGKLRERLRATIAAAQRIPGADGRRIVVIGFCFGGLCALDCARAGFPGVIGAVSFHGLFTPPNLGTQGKIDARVLALHGWDDPMAAPDSVRALTKELTEAGARWELDAYGNVAHGFSNPSAQDRANGIFYDAIACARSWSRLESFIAECVAHPGQCPAPVAR
ncbi:MAG: dienelactone hydrolase family protein [Phycisphaerales bacterium]|nr:dienelactone hydrolase family protein [Phycisphaerales bacterium]